ncbi:hypothetical protein [Burkholderia cenocepacia]|uniref:hypothetical protein n=1 Tax=Burkholderia cenocepacia TaxID=95486 RepID=UPI000D0C3FD2|nr:hypothetical protein [Burkholderia cenocepacia]SOT39815.1 hypothetical protein F01_230159 [Burkholderia cenocepacia]
MTAEGEVTMLIIDGSVSRMSDEEQTAFRTACELIRATVEAYGVPGLLALTYVTLEADQ